MLTSNTKKHIDAARAVLVGVAPNPTTQIDQITYALIYKFMDDMDQASVKAGGEASFFVGNLEKYAWSNLMSTRMGNQEKMDLLMPPKCVKLVGNYLLIGKEWIQPKN